MAKKLNEIYAANPSTELQDADLLYADRAPYSPGSDTAILFINLLAQIAKGLNVKAGCAAAATGNLNATYDNGTAGVGATLTNAGAFAAFSVDGATLAVGRRVMVPLQTDPTQNGIYEVLVAGSGAVAWVLGRPADFNSSANISINSSTYVTGGTLNTGCTYGLATAAPYTIGVTNLVFARTPAPLTTKGDIYVRNTSGNARLAVGTSSAMRLMPDSTDATGLKWDYPANSAAWQDFDGINVIAAQPFAPTGAVTAATGGVASDKIDESHVLMVVQVATTSIFAFVARIDSAGKPIIPDQSTWTTVTTTTITTATFPQVCVLPGSADAIVSFAATRSAVFCQVLVSLGINPSTYALTLGTEQTVRGTEIVATAGEVKGLSSTNFGLVFRTNTANILYAYQLSLAAGVITVGTLPLTIETGNATASNQRMAFKDSTHLDVLYRSTVTATSGFGYVARITFNGTGSLPTISSLLQVASAIGPANSNGMRLIPIPGATDYLIAVISGPTGISNFLAQPVHVNAGTPVLAGTAFTSETYWGLTSISAAMPEAGTLIIAAFTTNCAGYYILAVDGSYNVTQTFRWNTDAAANAPSKANMIPVNSGKHIFFSFVQITSNFPCASILRP